MQTLIQVLCNNGPSLRDAVVNDSKLEKFNLVVRSKQSQGRAPGWAKIGSDLVPGAINLDWDAANKILNCRVVNRGAARPDAIAGFLVEYLLARRRSRIQSIHISRR